MLLLAILARLTDSILLGFTRFPSDLDIGLIRVSYLEQRPRPFRYPIVSMSRSEQSLSPNNPFNYSDLIELCRNPDEQCISLLKSDLLDERSGYL